MARTKSRVFFHTLRVFCILAIIFIAAPQGTQAAGACGTGTWNSGNLEIHHINIGQGDSALIVGPTGRSLLFDAGESYWNSSIDAQTIGPYIESVLGCKSLDYVVISHFHVDHVGYVGHGGLWNLVETQGLTVGTTLLRDTTHYLGETSGTLSGWQTYLAGAGQAKLHPVLAAEGTSQVDLGPGVSFKIVTVNGNGAILAGDFHTDSSPPSENDYSIGAVLSFGNFDEWMGGDLDGQYQVSGGYRYHDIELSAAPEVGDVDVYKVNHHGSSHSSSATFINQIDPEVSVVSVGNANTYGHPTQVVMDRLLATSTVYLTERGDTNTNIGPAIVAGNIVIKTANGSTYTVNGTTYTATEPTRADQDGDGYFAEADPNDASPGTIPAPNGGCGSLYQACAAATVSCQAAAGQVLINEVFPSPNSNGIEWMELYNTTAAPVNIGYCIIDDIPGASPIYTIPASTIIPAHGFWTVDQTSYFNNAGDSVRFLKDDGNTLLDIFSYGNTIYDVSWYRAPDGGPWAASPTASPTKEQSNTGAATPTTFTDVPTSHPYYQDIEILFANGLTGGCSTSPLNFCPDLIMDRAQAAVFMMRGTFGAGYLPNPTANLFQDNWTPGTWARPWAEAMRETTLTTGCQLSPWLYCPWQQLPREQAMIFALKMKYGNGYLPPAATGTVFADMTDPNYYATSWAEQAYADGLIQSCGTSGGKPKICPATLVTRGLGAQMIVKAKNLTMP